MKLPSRLQQVLYYTSADRHDVPFLPVDVRARLTNQMAAQFAMLSSGDQHHLLRVYAFLKHAEAQDETITAGLIHDVGKACGRCTITIFDRGLHVVCSRIIPGLYDRFASISDPPERLLGVHRLANHARRGASAAAQCGYNDRICWLVLHHEARGSSIEMEADPELNLLREADAADTFDTNHIVNGDEAPTSPGEL